MDYSEYGAGVYIAMAHKPEARSILDNPNISLNDPRVWAEIWGSGGGTETGDSMTHEKAFMFPAYYQACEIVAGGCAKIPVKRYQQDASGVRKEAVDGPLSDLLQLQPNEQETAFPFWRRVFNHGITWGNSYIWIERDGNRRPTALYTLLPDRTRIETLDDGFMFVVTEVVAQLKPLPLSDVLHIQGLGWKPTGGLDFAMIARNSIALGLAQEKFSSKFFKHGGRIGGVLELPATMDKKTKDTVEEGFRKTYEDSDVPFKTVILRENAKFHAAQQSPQDAQLVEATEGQVRQMCRWFNLPPSKLGLADSASYASKAEDNQAFIENTLAPWLIQRDQQCTVKLQSASERQRYWFENDPSELLRMKPQEQAVYLTTLTQAAIMNKNEARRVINLEPYEGGDNFDNTNTASGAMQPQKTAPLPGGTNENGNGTNTGTRSADQEAFKRIVYGVGRNARYKAKKPNSFVEWVDGGMVSHFEEARKDAPEAVATIEAILVEMRKVLETTGGDALPGVVDGIMARFEKECG